MRAAGGTVRPFPGLPLARPAAGVAANQRRPFCGPKCGIEVGLAAPGAVRAAGFGGKLCVCVSAFIKKLEGSGLIIY